MTALTPPADDAPAEEWGALAVAIPDWRWPWQFPDTEVCPPMPGCVCVDGCSWQLTDDLRIAERGDAGLVFGPRQEIRPDPDHWAWWGWLLRLLGDRCIVRILPRGGRGRYEVVIPSGLRPDGRPHRVTGRILGRTAIAAAAAIGRWPGGAS